VGTQNECKEDNNSLDVGTQGVCTP
jgi:hypothetical protein